jgi:hypothetical protein
MNNPIKQSIMKQTLLPLGAVVLTALMTQQVRANFIVECYSDGKGYANFSYPGSTAPSSSTAKSTAAGCQATHSIFGAPHVYIFKYTPGVDSDNYSPSVGTSLGQYWNATSGSTSNVLATGTAGGGRGKYRVYAAWPSSQNITAAGTTITINTDDGAFVGNTTNISIGPVNQNNGGASGPPTPPGICPAATGNQWWLMAEVYLNNSTTYWVTSSAPASFVSQRFSALMWERVPDSVNPCLSTPAVGGVSGPFAANQTNITVTGVAAGAGVTAVVVYQGDGTAMLPIGTNSTSVASNTVVKVAPLTKGKIISATQVIAGQESCVPNSGPIVGGGANPKIRISASIRQPGGLTGPIGVNGGSPSATIYWIKATGFASGTAPAGGQVLTPSTNWQTVVFQPTTDSKFIWNNVTGGVTLPDPNQFGILEGFSFAMDDLTDTGPIQIYLDNLRNANVVIQDFENEAPGTEVQFPKPSNSGTTSGNLLSAPNSSFTSTNQAAFGTNSALVQWQWNGLSAGNWIRLNALSTSGTVPTPNPEVDLTQPIAVDVLVLPVGHTNAHSLGLIMGPSNVTTCPSSNVTFTVAATPTTGTGAYTYQWQRNGANIDGATTTSFSTNNVSSTSAGIYSVVVGDGIATNILSAVLTVYNSAQIDANLTSPQQINVGDQLYISGAASAPSSGCTPLPVTYQWLFNGTPIPGASGDVTSGVTYTKNNAQVADAGLYSFYVTSGYQTITSAVDKVYVVDAANRVMGNGSGLLGLYYSNHLAGAPFSPNNPVWTNTDPQIAFEWGAGAPDVNNSPSLVSTDRFTVRWLGQLQGEWAQTFTLYTTNDDGLRLWVDGKLVIDSWVGQGGQIEHSGTVALDTNLHPIVIEYYENTGNADVALFWDSASQVKEVVPMSQLYPAADYPAAPNISLTSPANNAAFNNPATVNLAASVTSNLQGIEMVQFYYGSTPTLLAQVTNAPYSYSWANPAAGTYNVFARVLYDNAAEHVDSGASTIHVTTTPPYVSSITGGAGSLSISGTGVLGQTFILQMASNLVSPISWKPIATNPTGSGAFNFTIAPGAVPSAFYRVQSK